MELIRDPRHEECLDRLSAGLRDPVPETEDCAKLRYARLDHCEAVCEALDKEGYLYFPLLSGKSGSSSSFFPGNFGEISS